MLRIASYDVSAQIFMVDIPNYLEEGLKYISLGTMLNLKCTLDATAGKVVSNSKCLGKDIGCITALTSYVQTTGKLALLLSICSCSHGTDHLLAEVSLIQFPGNNHM